MTVRRVTDPTPDRALIEAALASVVDSPITFERWLDAAQQEASRVYVDDVNGILLHIVITEHPSLQIIWWVPMEVTQATAFRLRLPVLAFALNDIVAELPAADSWRVWGFAPQTLCDGWKTRFGRVAGQFIVISEDGQTARNGLPLVNNTFRASGLVSAIRAAAVRLA